MHISSDMQDYKIAPFIIASLILHILIITSITQRQPPYKSHKNSNKNIINIKFISLTPENINNNSKLKNHPIKAQQKEKLNNYYYSLFDLDEPAAPVGEWVINTDVLPINEITNITIKLWISDKGVIDKWEALSDFDPDIINLALHEIGRTPINAAKLNGKGVASIMKLELVIDRNNPYSLIN